MATKNEQLADKYPVKYSHDGGNGIKLGDLVKQFADFAESLMLTSPLAREKLADWLDREFLFGCWGFAIREIREYKFTRDIRGFIVAAYKEGLLRGRICSEVLPPDCPLKEPAEEQWCWREKNGEVAYGPFTSREEAIEEAKTSSDSRVVMIGNVVWPDPVAVAGEMADIDHLMEQMEEYAYDNGLSHDDSIFDLKTNNAKEAQEGLKKHLRAWAEEFVATPTYWHTSEQEEEVEIHPEVDNGQG